MFGREEYVRVWMVFGFGGVREFGEGGVYVLYWRYLV